MYPKLFRDISYLFKSEQGLPDTTKVDLKDTTQYMYEFIELFVGEAAITNRGDFESNGMGLLKDAIEVTADEEINGQFELHIKYDSDGFLADKIENGMIIKARANDKQDEQLFRIYNINKNHNDDSILIDAQHITYDLANGFVQKLEANNLSKKEVMEKILAETDMRNKAAFTMTSPNNSTVSSTKLYRTNPLQMVGGTEGSVLQIWGGEIERDNHRLVLHDRRGSDDGVLVTYAKNLTGLEAKFDMSKMVTAIYPFIYIEETDEEPEKLITIESENNGSPYIYSPLVDHYDEIFYKPLDMSNEEIENSKDLYNATKDYFEKEGRNKDKPDVSIDVEFEPLWQTEEYKDLAPLELVGMGDTVTVRHSKFNIDIKANVNRIEYDVIAEKNKSVELGSVKTNLTDKVNDIDRVERKVDNVDRKTNRAIASADNKNTNYYGPDEPTGSGLKKGDLWFRVVEGEYTRTYRYDGIQWQIIMDMADKEAEDAAQAARERADEAVDGVETVTEMANDLAIRVGGFEEDLSSQYTQLENMINLRVEKDDIINQINISDEDILISGRKLILDGDTVVNGDFKVQRANIPDLDAGMVTFGTLDGAQASIININADNIDTGTLDAERITVKVSNGIQSVQIDDKGLRSVDSSGNVRIHLGVRNISGKGQSDPSTLRFFSGDGGKSASIGMNVNNHFIIGSSSSKVATELHSGKNLLLYGSQVRVKPKHTDKGHYARFASAKNTSGTAREIAFQPDSSGRGYIGTKNYRWWRMYLNHLHYYEQHKLSRREFKENIKDLPLEYINNVFKDIRLKSFNYKRDGFGNNPCTQIKPSYGVILDESPPEIISEDGNSIVQDNFIVVIAAALKYEQNRNDKLESRIKKLERSIS